MKSEKNASSPKKGFWKKTGIGIGQAIGIDTIQDGAKFIVHNGRAILTPVRSNRVENFNEAMVRLGVQDEDIKKNYINFVRSFWISFFFAVVCLAYGFNMAFHSQIIGALACLSITTLCLSNCFRFSFRAFQIKHKKLCSANEWFARKSEWFPEFK
jgi:hypothetical protein